MPITAARRLLLFTVLWTFFSVRFAAAGFPVPPDPAPQAVAAEALAALAAGRPQELVVLLDGSLVEAEAANRRRLAGLAFNSHGILELKAKGFRGLKRSLEPVTRSGEAEVVRDYPHLPMVLLRLRSPRALDLLLARPETVALYRDAPLKPHLSYSLPFIGHPSVARSGIGGEGATVAVIDTGVDYTLPAFGSCSEPGAPQGCRVRASVDVTGNGLTLNSAPANHGTNVAGIVAGVAPGAGIVSINAFVQGGSKVSWILAAIDWAIANQAAYGIASLNMSFGDGAVYGAPCDRHATNPFLSPLAAARDAGMVPVASSGNEGATGGISNPACTPGVVSVGAVYDAYWGGPYAWGGTPPTCSETLPSAPDRIPCFSNSASYLTLLAPGAFVTAAGIQKAGTSQAAPHVAAAAALLRSRYPGDTLDETAARLTGSGVPVTDPRSGVTTPRLNLPAAFPPPENDAFAGRIPLSGDAGALSATNLNATREPGEPLHAGGQGGSSVWWSWAPSQSGAATVAVAGAGFTPLLSVYSGAELGSLTRVADGAGATATFAAIKGTHYQIAVDGALGGFGGLVLDRRLDLRADLVLDLVPPAGGEQGRGAVFALTARNNGPSLAVGATVAVSLPDGLLPGVLPAGCTLAAGTVNCAVGDLEPGESAPLALPLTPERSGTFLVTAHLSSATEDPVASDNAAGAAWTAAPLPEPVPALSPLGAGGCALLLCYLLRRSGIRRR